MVGKYVFKIWRPILDKELSSLVARSPQTHIGPHTGHQHPLKHGTRLPPKAQTGQYSPGKCDQMGCSISHSNDESEEDNLPTKNDFVLMSPSLEKLLRSKNPPDLLSAFVELDKAIMAEESRNASSIFGLAMSRQQLIKTHLMNVTELKNHNEILSGESPTYDLFRDIGLVKNPQSAAEHEEFLASINRRAINQNAMELLEKMKDSVDEQIKTSSGRISQLQSAYHQQDELLGQIFGETYGSDREKAFEKDLDTMRYFRDMLSIGFLQWELCLNSTRTAVNLLRKGVSSWKDIKEQSLEQKIASATESRNSIQEALLLIQTSQEVLRDVQFPHCTARDLKNVSQAIEYVFTDILLEERYSHATEVYEHFLQRAISLEEWIEGVLYSQLQKDLFEIEEKVAEAAVKLRNERVYLICKNLRVQPPSENLLEVNIPVLANHTRRETSSKESTVFQSFGKFPVNLETKLGLEQREGESSLQDYFRKIVENRKNTMWPSRRIDELQTLMVQE